MTRSEWGDLVAMVGLLTLFLAVMFGIAAIAGGSQ